MYLAHPVRGEHRLQILKSVFQILQVHLLTLLYQRINHIHLPPLGNFAPDAVVEANLLVVVFVYGLYRLASRGQFVYHAHVEVSVKSHSEGARYGCCRHHEDVRRIVVLRPQLCPLCHTEAVLFVYHGNAEVVKDYGIFYYGMCTHQYLHLSVGEALQYGGAFLAFHDACQQFYTHIEILQEFLYRGKMLLCQYLCRCHHDGLKTVVNRYEHRHQRH